MVANAVIIAAAVGLLGGLLFYEKKDDIRGKLLTKLPLSGLFILAAVLQPHPHPLYFGLLLAGLIFCLLGDGCLIATSRTVFLAGLAVFLLGHCCYTAAFLARSGMNAGFLWGLMPAGIAGGMVFGWLKPRLNEMKRPVAAYIVVISLMLCAAAGFSVDASVSGPARGMVFAGAAFFYLSDIAVARQRFVRPGFENRLIGLPLYYAGQFLLAYSTGLV